MLSTAGSGFKWSGQVRTFCLVCMFFHAPSLLSGFPSTDLDVRLLVSLYWLHACLV